MLLKKLFVVLSWPLAAATGILWINNLVSAGRFYLAVASGGVAVEQEAFPGIWDALAWSTLDYSTVSTFVPFFGFLLTALTPFRSGRAAADESWPFFPGYERMNIALGLLGTVWGIILIGFYPSSQVSIAALMKCLHTAMFSTLVSVAWVMVALPLVILPVFRRRDGGEPVGEEDFAADCAAFTGAINEAAAAATRFNGELAGVTAKLEEVGRAAAALAGERRELGAAVGQLNAAAALLSECQKRLEEENRRLAGAEAQWRGEVLALRAETAKLSGMLDGVRAAAGSSGK